MSIDSISSDKIQHTQLFNLAVKFLDGVQDNLLLLPFFEGTYIPPKKPTASSSSHPVVGQAPDDFHDYNPNQLEYYDDDNFGID